MLFRHLGYICNVNITFHLLTNGGIPNEIWKLWKKKFFQKIKKNSFKKLKKILSKNLKKSFKKFEKIFQKI
jgi:hypothetical protein